MKQNEGDKDVTNNYEDIRKMTKEKQMKDRGIQ